MSTSPHDLFEPVIGLEIHLQLNTKTKLFSSAPNRFGDEPNTNISVVCTGQPGALPVLNKAAVDKGILFGLAVQADIARTSAFDRKSYFYPDSPRNFQITQYYAPLLRGGLITAEVDGELRTFTLDRAHLEDDAGMLKHFTHFAGIDDNRAGCPLIEIVSTPCMHSAKEAAAYAMAIRAIALYLNISDGNMEEGSLRIDANISVRPRGETTLRPRVEIKNLNSFTFLQMAIDSEIRRQTQLYLQNPHRPFLELLPPGTYRWDQEKKETVFMRGKESAEDYRYFPEPDLLPLSLSEEWIDSLRASLPELPLDKMRRYISDLGLTPYAANLLTQEKTTADYFETALKTAHYPRALCNWITIEFAGRLKESGKTLLDVAIPPEHVGELVHLIETKRITGKMGKILADAMLASPGVSPSHIVEGDPQYTPLEDDASLETLVDEVLREFPQSIEDYRAGKGRALGFLVGQVMKKTGGKASPEKVNALLQKKLSL